MTITPCRTCHLKADCQIKAGKLKAIRGLKLTSIKFRCDVKKESITPGMKGTAKLLYVAVGRGIEGDIWTEKRQVDCVVMGWSGPKVKLYIPYDDDGPWWLHPFKSGMDSEERVHVVKVDADQLKLSDEVVSTCVTCGLPEGVEMPRWTCGIGGEEFTKCGLFTDDL